METITRLSVIALTTAFAVTSASATPLPPVMKRNDPMLTIPIVDIPQDPGPNIPIVNIPQNQGPDIPIVVFPKTPGPNIPIVGFPKPKPNIPILNPWGHGTPPKDVELAVDCEVKSPLGITDDIWIVNTGEVELPAGLVIKFRVPSTHDHGAFLLPRGINVGDKLKVPDLLHDALSGAPCTARIVS